MTNKTEMILELQKSVVGHILTIAESSLPESQFRAFKKLVFQTLHDTLKPGVISIMRQDQVRATPHELDNFGEKGGRL